MKVARIFVKPNGDRWFDLPLNPDQNARLVFSMAKVEGAIVHDVFVVPYDTVHSIGILEVNGPPAPSRPPIYGGQGFILPSNDDPSKAN